MSINKNREEKKCVAIHLPLSTIEKLDIYKTKSGKSKNAILIEFIEKGLSSVEL